MNLHEKFLPAASNRRARRGAMGRPAIMAVIAAVAHAGASATCGADVISSTYVGPPHGNWDDASSWSPPIVPNNGVDTFDVRINGDPAQLCVVVVPNVPWYTVRSLTIDAGDQLMFAGSGILTVTGETIFNDGGLLLTPDGGQIRFAAPTLNLVGAGEVAMRHGAQFRAILGQTTTFNIGPGITMHGAGSIGQFDLRIMNSGVIRGDAGEPLNLNAEPLNPSVNDGLILAANAGWVAVRGPSTLQNTNGKIIASDGGVIQIELVKVIGGELRGEGSGSIDVAFNVGATTFVDVLSNGTMRGLGGPLNGIGSWTNNGQFLCLGTTLVVESPELLLTGTGTYVMPGSPGGGTAYNRITAAAGGTHRLINDSAHTIRGAGFIGQHTLQLTNRGVIQATQSGPLYIEPAPAYTNYNQGTIEAIDAALMTISQAGTLDNTGGVLRATGFGRIRLEGTKVVGGQLVTDVTGKFETTPTGFTLLNTTLNGTLSVQHSCAAIFQGTVTNNGTIVAEGEWPTGAEIRIGSNAAVLAGTGTLQMTGGTYPARIRNTYAATNKLVNGAGHTIRGAGQIGLNTLGIVNDGVIIADLAAGLTIDPSDSWYFENNGELRASGAGSITIGSGPFNNYGSVIIEPGRTITRSGSYGQESGTTVVNGTLTVIGGSFLMIGGSLTGSGRVNGTVVNAGGRVFPDAGVAQLEIVGSYEQSARGTLAVELLDINMDMSSDRLKVVGIAQLGGKLELSFVGGHVPPPGSEFVVLSATRRQGQFDSVQCPVAVEVTYTDTQVIVRIAAPPAPEDLNGDGVIDAADLDILLSNWGRCPGAPCTSDLNDDGIVDGADVGLLLGAWKRSGAAR